MQKLNEEKTDCKERDEVKYRTDIQEWRQKNPHCI